MLFVHLTPTQFEYCLQVRHLVLKPFAGEAWSRLLAVMYCQRREEGCDE